jgi:ABC-2 type transport system permease protein
MTGSLFRWWPVFRREFVASIQAPSLSIFAGLFFALVGIFFSRALVLFVRASLGDPLALSEFQDQPLNVNDAVAQELFGILFSLLLFAVPFLSMRLVAEERKVGTYDLLMSFPLRELDVVIGKFLAAWAVTGCLLGLSLLYPAILWWASGGQLEVGPVAAAYFGLLLVSAAFVGVGLFASCLTENQLVAGLMTLGVLLVLLLLNTFTPPESSLLSTVLSGLDLYVHAEWFLRGVVRIGDVSHFVVMTVIMLYLAEKALSFRRMGVVR